VRDLGEIQSERPDDQPEPSVTESPNPNIVDTDTITGEMHPIRRAVVSIGSNVGERRVNLQGAVDSLADTPEVWVTAVSPVYQTEPIDAPEGSKDFLNAIVLIDTTLSARTLLDRAQAIESAYGREHGGARNAPRTLDVDLIVVGDRRADEEDLVLPHPRASERAFVLVPWHDLEPEAEIPGVGPVAELVEKTGREGVALREDIELGFG
jgi:2-amino-4-hydroxy-6-hydroxymethyldihydropteridine diphosphokinase